MAALQQSNQSNLRQRNLRNGAMLALTQTVRLVNLPLAQEVGEHVHRLIVALKAPKDNDMNMQTLAEQIQNLMGMLQEAREEMNDKTIVDLYGKTARCCEQFQKLYEYLGKSLLELQSLYDCRFATKFASQTNIHETVMRIKDELVIHLIMFNLTIGLTNSQTVQWLAESVDRRLVTSEERIERLEDQVNAVLLARGMDTQFAYFGFAGSGVFFF